MNNLIVIISFLLFLGCNSNAVSQAKKEDIKIQKVQKKEVVTKPKVMRSNIVKNTSRPKNKIDSIFPFDITLEGLDGKEILSNTVLKQKGKPTVILFWLTTCFPCMLEMEAIKKKYEGWKKESDFNLVAISTDFPKNKERIAKKAKSANWQWPVFWDKNREFTKVMPGRLNGLPQTFIYDKNNKLVFHKRKFHPGDEDKLYLKIKEIIANQ